MKASKRRKRTNYDGWVLPIHADQTEDLAEFWPTDDEYVIIFNTTFGLPHLNQLLERFSEEKVKELRPTIANTDYYAWFLDHLQEETKGYTVPLTEELVLLSLEKFMDTWE